MSGNQVGCLFFMVKSTLSDDCHFIDEMACTCEFINDKQCVADVYTSSTL